MPLTQKDNAIFGKIGRLASEEVVLNKKQVYITILLYGLEPFDPSITELKSLDFVNVINRFLRNYLKQAWKLFTYGRVILP